MRKLVTLGIATIFLAIGLGLFIVYFPNVWGAALFPYPYQDIYLKSWQDQQDKGCDMPRNLPVAVGYVESGHNPTALSSARAVGIMQLIPGTAKGVAKQIGMTDFTLDKLTDPAVNIKLGTAYLCSVLLDSKNDLSMALARYNMGPRAANRDLWPRSVEGYVRKVLGVLDAYNKIYGVNGEGAQTPFVVNQPRSFLSIISPKNLLNILSGPGQ